MEVGTLVDCVNAIPGTSNLIAVGCDEGQFYVYDVETEKSVFELDLSDAVIAANAKNDSLIYTSTEGNVFLHDIREKDSKKLIFASPAEISDFDVFGSNIAIATVEKDILFTDKRILKKNKTSVLPPVCTSLRFRTMDKLVTGYLDTSVGEWDISKKSFKNFAPPSGAGMNPPVVHSIAVKGQTVIAANQIGISIYQKGNHVVTNSFEHDGTAVSVCFAPCFPEDTFISGGKDGSLMVFNLKQMKPIDCIANEDEVVQCVTANNSFIAVADTTDNGVVGIFRPEDFGNEEEA